MKSFVHSASLVSGLLAMGLFGNPTMAGRGSDNDANDNRDLKGEYLCTIIEVHQLINSPVEHCNLALTGNFNGAGRVDASGMMRCSGSFGTGVLSGSLNYSVNPDGSFLMSDLPNMANPSHGQIVDHGRTLLLDGSTKTNPEILSWSGICMRR